MTISSEVPALLVGFDVESTGLDTQNDEAISYGFAEFVNGQLVGTDEFYVLPDVQIHPGAEKVHGVSYEQLRRKFRDGEALSSCAGATRAVGRLLEYASRGATFVGANPMFDYTMLDSTLRRHGLADLAGFGFDLGGVVLTDVVTRDLEIEPSRSKRPRRGLAFLCTHYGVVPGNHQAAQDARAACEVMLAQIAYVAQFRDVAEQVDYSDVEVVVVRHRISNWMRSFSRSR